MAPMTCLIAPPLGPPSARHGRGRAEAGPYALLQQLFHTPLPAPTRFRGSNHHKKGSSAVEEPCSGQPGSRTLNLASRVNSQHVSCVRLQLVPAEPDMHLSAHPALQKLAPSRAASSRCVTAHSLCLASCTPSPCLRRYPEHLSTMGTPSPCVSRHVGDPQVTRYLRSVCRFPLRLFPWRGWPDEGFIDALNLHQ